MVVRAIDIVAEAVWRERVPPHANVDWDTELEMALSQPFTALDLALRRGHDPRLWAKVKGTVYEPTYRDQLQYHGESEDPRAMFRRMSSKMSKPVRLRKLASGSRFYVLRPAFGWQHGIWVKGRNNEHGLAGHPDYGVYYVGPDELVVPVGQTEDPNYDASRSRVSEGEDPKHFLKRIAPPAQFEVEGTWQAWVADGSGNVMYDLEAKMPRRAKIVGIKKFNVEEYKQRNGKWPSGQVSLQQISYWDHRGNYFTCGPELRGITRPPAQ